MYRNRQPTEQELNKLEKKLERTRKQRQRKLKQGAEIQHFKEVEKY